MVISIRIIIRSPCSSPKSRALRRTPVLFAVLSSSVKQIYGGGSSAKINQPVMAAEVTVLSGRVAIMFTRRS